MTRSSPPDWLRAKDWLLKELRGTPIGGHLPPASDAARKLRLSAAPVVRAYQALQAEGFISHGRGRRARVLSHVSGSVQGFGASVKQLGLLMTTVWAEVGLVGAGADETAMRAAKALLLGPGDAMILVSRVRKLAPAGAVTPVRWDRAYMPAALFPATLLHLDFAQDSPPGLMDLHAKAGLTPSTREFTVTAALADRQEARMLARALPARRAASASRAVLRLSQISVCMKQEPVPYEYLVSVCLDWTLIYRR